MSLIAVVVVRGCATHSLGSRARAAIVRFVGYYDQERVHEAIGNLPPDELYHGRRRDILSRRERIQRLTLERRKNENLRNAA